MNTMKQGIKDGIPIGLGYLSVSFTFGILAVSRGLDVLQALLISMTTITSAGQFAGLTIMCTHGACIEMLTAQIIINMRYALMSISLSQKADEKFRGKFRWLLGAFITDEIFAVAISQKEKVSYQYFWGLSIVPYVGWSLGTLFGAVLGSVIPDSLSSALGIALYGMFVAIIMPKMREDLKVLQVILLAVILSSIFYYTPLLKRISVGFSITICSVIAAGIGAAFNPDRSQGVDEE